MIVDNLRRERAISLKSLKKTGGPPKGKFRRNGMAFALSRDQRSFA
jgi:hypothetical protein